MFLPILLVRDFGLWGYVAFAVPNIIGAAGMGWVLRSRTSAQRILREHGDMTQVFSLVTVAFQLFFLLSLSTPTPVRTFAAFPTWAFLLIAVGIGQLIVTRKGSFFGMLVWAASAGLLVAAWSHHGLDFRDVASAGAREPGIASTDVLWLAPVCAFGFLLCPYLDMTFCRARASMSQGQARAAFTLGFGVLFAAMILATLGYALTAFMGWRDPGLVSQAVRTLLGLHIGLQLMFTVFVHIVELVAPARQQAMRRYFWPWIALVMAAGAGLALGTVEYRGISAWEVAYRLFMAFYGLAFPAYVWLCMIPPRGHGQTRTPRRATLKVYFGAITLASPFYWMGFIERETWWLGPGLFIVLAARLAVRPEPAASND